MKYPSPVSPPPKPPEWFAKVRRSLKGKLSPDAYEGALKILNHPKADEARQMLNRAWNGDYPAFAEIIKACAICNGPEMNVPSIFFDKKGQGKQARNAKNLQKVIERLSRLGGGSSVRSGALASRIFKKMDGASPVPADLYERLRQEAEGETPNISDAAIIDALHITAECLELMATAPRGRGKPEDLRVRNVLAFLDSRLTKDFGKVDLKVAACLLKASFPEKKEKKPDNIRNLLKNLRNK